MTGEFLKAITRPDGSINVGPAFCGLVVLLTIAVILLLWRWR